MQAIIQVKSFSGLIAYTSAYVKGATSLALTERTLREHARKYTRSQLIEQGYHYTADYAREDSGTVLHS
jgi:hypothetical protein